MLVVIGTNSFVDCENIVILQGNPLLKVAANPLRLTVVTPQNLPSGRHVRVVDNISAVNDQTGKVRVISSEQSVQIFWDNFLLVVGTLIAPETVHIHIDLRPIGILCHDDQTGLHVGNINMSSSTFTGTNAAFTLG